MSERLKQIYRTTTISGVARAIGAFLVHLLQAVVGTAIIESPLHGIFHPNTRFGIIVKEDLLSGTVAFAVGYFVYYKWHQIAPLWVWLVGFFWFGVHTLSLSRGDATIGAQLAGTGCFSDPGSIACRDWQTFTIPLLRTLFYSAGALYALGVERGVVRRNMIRR